MRKIKIKKIILLIPFIFFSQLVFNQSKSIQNPNKTSSIKGWENLTWESTETEVKQKYENQLTILETVGKYNNGEYYCPFEIKGYKFTNYIDLTVSFIFDEKTKKLVQINLTKENPTNILNTLQDLKLVLSEKYGKPKIIEETPSYYISWSFQDLNIELTHIGIKSFDKILMNSIILSYKKSLQTKQAISDTTKHFEKTVNTQQLEVPIYKLYPTENYWTFIKLDTRNGKMWQVHFTVSGEGYQGEKELNLSSLVLTDEEIKGRFTLIPTKNTYNFLLLDQLIGKTYQVQWNNEFGYRFVRPIW